MKTLLFAALIGAVLTGPVRSDPLTDTLFAEGMFDEMPDGQAITYALAKSGGAVPGAAPPADGRIVVTASQAADGTRSLSLTTSGDGRQREVADFPASGGNPVLMLFLESTVRGMATTSGGSPFYIRNRIKEALRQGGDLVDTTPEFAGGTVAAQEVTLHPFRDDPNRERMKDFAGLSLRFVVSKAVPGRFLLLSADTPEAGSGYHETITLLPTAGVE